MLCSWSRSFSPFDRLNVGDILQPQYRSQQGTWENLTRQFCSLSRKEMIDTKQSFTPPGLTLMKNRISSLPFGREKQQKTIIPYPPPNAHTHKPVCSVEGGLYYNLSLEIKSVGTYNRSRCQGRCMDSRQVKKSKNQMHILWILINLSLNPEVVGGTLGDLMHPRVPVQTGLTCHLLDDGRVEGVHRITCLRRWTLRKHNSYPPPILSLPPLHPTWGSPLNSRRQIPTKEKPRIKLLTPQC